MEWDVVREHGYIAVLEALLHLVALVLGRQHEEEDVRVALALWRHDWDACEFLVG